MSEGTGIALERVRRTTNWRILVLGMLALLGAAVLTALVVLQQQTDAARDRAIGLQQHTFEVVIRANQLSGAIATAEAALGRYVVSADKTLGQQYTAQWSRAREQLNRLQQATRGNDDQQRRIADLRQAFEERGAELNETALYSTARRDRDAWGSYYRIRQSAARERVERLLTQLVERERALLAQRTGDARDLLDTSSLAYRVLLVFGVLIVIGSVILGWLAIAAAGERAVADAEADAERERAQELQFAVDAATEEVRAQAREREAAEAQLRQAQKMDAVGQLTGGIAHDFNNMLAVVLGGLELARRHIAQPGEAQRHIDSAMDGANRAAALTRRLLAFSRSEPLLPEGIAATTLIAGMSDLLDRTLGDQIRVETGDDGKRWNVWVDRHQLENALLNLAVNARDAMDGRGTLSILTGGTRLAVDEVGDSVAGEYVTITVRDTGHGIPPDVLERVFEPFFSTKPVGRGTGLGLSQIFAFVRQSGGEIAIDTAPDQGTAVTLYLPRHIGEVAAAAPRKEATPAPAPAAAGTLDVLVVEDDPRVLGATVGALTELGHRVTSCQDPLAVPGLLDKMTAIDLIMSDVLMPGQTGPEMIGALEGRMQGVAVLFVTGFAGEVDAETFANRPVLRKPFTIAALERAVGEAIEWEACRTPQVAAE